MDASSSPDASPLSSVAAASADEFDLLAFVRSHIILLFFAVLGVSSLSWMIGFNMLAGSKEAVTRLFRALGVSTPRTRRALQELHRKSFHLAGLLIPFIYYLGLHHSGGLLTRTRGVVILGVVTAFFWTVEILRWMSPAFRGHYNRLFTSLLRQHELETPASAAVQAGTFAHSVDQLVQSITTPLLGELPPSPRHNPYDHATPHLRGGFSASPSTQSRTQLSFGASPSHVLPTSAILGTPPPNEKIFTGTGFFFLGNWLAMLLFEPTIATCGMLFLVLGDMTAAIIGISFGTIKIGKKSLEGTAAMFFVCLIVGSIFYSAVPGTSFVVFIASLAATLVELFGPADKWWADDNLTIPLSTGLVFTAAFYLTAGAVPEAVLS